MKTEEINTKINSALKNDVLQEKILQLNQLAWELRLKSLYEQSLEVCFIAIEILEKTIDSLSEVTILNTIANVYSDIGEYTKSLDMFQKAIKLLEDNYNGYWLGAVLLNCGNVYKNLGKYEIALEYYFNALRIFEKEGFEAIIPVCITNIGNVYQLMNKFQDALSYHFKALNKWEKIENKSTHSTPIYSNIGNCYFELQEFDKAIEFYKKSLVIDIEHEFTMDIAIDYANLGRVYAHNNFWGYNPTMAEEYLLKANTFFEKLDNKQYQFVFHKEISQLYRNEKNWEKADYHFRKFYEIEKEVLSEEAQRKSEVMENRRKIEEAEKDRQIKLTRFQEQERIFHNILPISIANRLIEGEKTIAEFYNNVSIFFSDIVGFTKLSSSIEPSKLVEGLNVIFTAFDRIGTRYGLEKIKTIGDAYMAVCGVPEQFVDHQYRTAQFAVEASKILQTLELSEEFNNLQIRIGLHCGSVVAGIIGEKKFAYDVWGDAVNIASRMESNSEAGRINISEAFSQSIQKHSEFKLIPRGGVAIKGKGTMNTFWLEKA